jgi:Co/Zn/Cd efflux system component
MHDHDHHHPSPLRRVLHVVRPHSHEAADKVDAAMESSAEGLRALWISLGVLVATAAVQAVVVAFSGSVALLGDTLHNAADALTALPRLSAALVHADPETAPGEADRHAVLAPHRQRSD